MPDGFDGAYAFDVIEHVGDPAAYLREIDRVTRTGGRLAIATPNRFSLAPEPHIGVWGVGWLPRTLQRRYAEWRSGKPYAFTRLMSTWEAARLLRRLRDPPSGYAARAGPRAPRTAAPPRQRAATRPGARSADRSTEAGDEALGLHPGERVVRLVGHLRTQIEASHQRTAGEVLYEHLRRTTSLARLAASDDAAAARSVARFFDLVRSRSALLADARVVALVPHLDELIDVAEPVADDSPLDLDAVSVLTVHRAKGLQFRYVYLTGMVDGRFPVHSRPPALGVPWHEIHGTGAESVEDRLSEERRLCYVAMTRAMDELVLTTHVAGAGGRGRRRPSPFIAEALDLPIDKPADRSDHLPSLVAAPSTPPSKARVVGLPATSFSFSMLEEYLDCPERYRLRHVVGLPTPPHHALTYGRAMHAAVAWFHLRMAALETPSEAELAAEFRRAWLSEGFLSREHEEARFAAGLRALTAFRARELAMPAPVVAVERPFEFTLDGMRIRGRVDRLDEDERGTVIVDYKSADVRDQRKANEKTRGSLQLHAYALAHEQRSGRLPRAMQLHFLESGLVGESSPDPGRLDKARQQLRGAMAGIAAKEFAPQPNAVTCGYCPFRQICAASAA